MILPTEWTTRCDILLRIAGVRVETATAATTSATATTVVGARHAGVLGTSGRVHRSVAGSSRAASAARTGRSTTAATSTASSETAAAVVDARRRRDVVVHALPGAAAVDALALHAGHLLALVLLLLEDHLLLGVEAGLLLAGAGRGRSGHATSGVSALHSTALLHTGATLHATTLLLLLLLLHGSHLLHHLGVHATGAALAATHAGHHLLHHLGVLLHGSHLRVHATGHTATLHLLLHHLEVLLHALPVLGHHGRAHVVCAAGLSSLVLLGAKVVLVSTTTAASARTAKAAATTSTSTLLAEVTTRLGALNFDRFAVNGERLRQGTLNSLVVVKGDEAESTGTAGVLVHHEGTVENVAELCEELTEVCLGCLLGHTSDENLRGLLLLVTWDCALRVNLYTSVSKLLLW
jgi:hypothetical protein